MMRRGEITKRRGKNAKKEGQGDFFLSHANNIFYFFEFVNKCKNLAPCLPALIINQNIKPTENCFRLRSELVSIRGICTVAYL